MPPIAYVVVCILAALIAVRGVLKVLVDPERTGTEKLLYGGGLALVVGYLVFTAYGQLQEMLAIAR